MEGRLHFPRHAAQRGHRGSIMPNQTQNKMRLGKKTSRARLGSCGLALCLLLPFFACAAFQGRTIYLDCEASDLPKLDALFASHPLPPGWKLHRGASSSARVLLSLDWRDSYAGGRGACVASGGGLAALDRARSYMDGRRRRFPRPEIFDRSQRGDRARVRTPRGHLAPKAGLSPSMVFSPAKKDIPSNESSFYAS